MRIERESSLPIERWNALVAINLTAVFHLSQLAFEPLRASGHGSIVNIASILGFVAATPMKQAGYCASNW